MPTIAMPPRAGEAAHWYTLDGVPCYEVEKTSGPGRRPVDLRDARKTNLVPSVTTILRVLNKPQLNDWLTDQAVLAVLTSVRNDGESLDDFVRRILHKERVQDQESEKAATLGRAIHWALECAMSGKEWDEEQYGKFVHPILKWRMSVGSVVWTEKVLLGDCYAGKSDMLLDNESLGAMLLVDFKSAKNLPKDSYVEHKLQTAAYAACIPKDPEDNSVTLTANVYISTSSPGEFVVHTQRDWAQTYVHGFERLLHYWQWANNYKPNMKP